MPDVDLRLEELPSLPSRLSAADLLYVVRSATDYKAEIGYLAGLLGPSNQATLALTANTTLAVDVNNVVLVTPNADSWEITVPNGMTNGGWVWLRNESATYNFIVKNAGGTTLATIEADGFGVFSN